MENIVCNYELTSAPRSFFDDLNHGGEGKSKLVHVIRDAAEDVPMPTELEAYVVIDAMQLVQRLKKTNEMSTFQDLAAAFIS